MHVVSHDKLYTASELSALKIWLVSPGIESVSKVSDCGSHVKHVVTGDGCFSAVHDVSYDIPYTVSELSGLKIWLVSLGIETVCKIIDRGSHVKRVVTRNGSLSAVHDVPYDSLVTGLELSAAEPLLVRPVIGPVCKVTDCGSHVKHVVSKDEGLSCRRWGLFRFCPHYNGTERLVRAACNWVGPPLITMGGGAHEHVLSILGFPLRVLSAT